jgi:hypothetical protein
MVFLELLNDLVIGSELDQELTMLIMLGGLMENLVILMSRISSLSANGEHCRLAFGGGNAELPAVFSGF